MHPALCVDAVVGRTAGFTELVAERLGACWLAYRLLRLGAEGHDLVSPVVYGGGLDRFAVIDDGVEADGDAAQLAVNISLSGVGKHTLGVPVRLAAHAVHILFIAVKIALCEASARESVLKGLYLVGGRGSVLLYDL